MFISYQVHQSFAIFRSHRHVVSLRLRFEIVKCLCASVVRLWFFAFFWISLVPCDLYHHISSVSTLRKHVFGVDSHLFQLKSNWNDYFSESQNSNCSVLLTSRLWLNRFSNFDDQWPFTSVQLLFPFVRLTRIGRYKLTLNVFFVHFHTSLLRRLYAQVRQCEKFKVTRKIPLQLKR